MTRRYWLPLAVEPDVMKPRFDALTVCELLLESCSPLSPRS